ncbi:L-serine ammonia-lyase [Arenicella xantha]|uniref:L-serine dehydratase n=1 Tax=Arenicella xantha TaxID=644221 RepID=A0A395JNU1_9GAMM|nr:L-serine ammonia-lyase [Arenicella xantha]RBP53314.1 L-serine ammonia-lyase [Arenicella xantha]
MSISAFDLFSIGIGPSSSHTVGPMRAAGLFLDALQNADAIHQTARIKVELFGSLGATGKGHGSPKAVVLGLMGETPESVDVATALTRYESVKEQGVLNLAAQKEIKFDREKDLILHFRKSLPGHSNGMTFMAYDESGAELVGKTYYSVGGGFVVPEGGETLTPDTTPLPYTFASADELLALCDEHQLSISELMLQNEKVWRSEAEIERRLLDIWAVMQECVSNGLRNSGVLPGGLKVQRRAKEMHDKLLASPERSLSDPLAVLDWVTLYALAVNEENAAGGRVVTAPTNGAAGIIPAVLHYYTRFTHGASEQGVMRFLLTAAAIGILYKRNASISGAEVGCQGEVGSACSMAAGALTEVLGGSTRQVENAAEIAMEHNLGLTCDPIGGLVQVPCIERNAMASVKAIHAARIALKGDGSHYVSLDKVIKTMRLTGKDMKDKYKETARGGLAINVVELPVNVVEC